MADALETMAGRGAKGQKGFTLTELLVVLGIIVAMAGVVVPQVVQSSDRGDQGASGAE
jgi:prepilin-type N-terminal cleavage/methylation domain-containing protein